MHVPFSVSDFLDRAVQVYGDRVGVVDEPDQPAPSLGDLTYAEMGALARRQAARLDELGIGVGERVAIVSHNSARLLTSFFGVSGSGRVLVPVNFRLRPDEVRYIVEHSGARVLYVDPELDETLADVDGRAPVRAGRRRRAVRRGGRRARALGARRDGDGDDQLHVRHDGPAQGRADHAPQHLDQRGDLRAARRGHRPRRLPAHAAAVPRQRVGDAVRDDRARRAAHRPAQGRRRRDPAPGREHGVTVMCAAPAVAAAVLDAAPNWEGEIPGRDRVRIIMAGAPPPTKTVARVEEELGWEFIQIYGLTETSPLLTVNRRRAEWDDLRPRSAPPSWSAPARRRSAYACIELDESEGGRTGRGAGPLQRRARGLLGEAGGDRAPRSRTAGSTPATAASSATTATSRSPTARRT